MNEREFAELAAGYALDTLSPADLAAFEAARAAHPEWADIVDADVATAAALAVAVTPVDPPPVVRASLLAQLAHTPQEVTDPAAEPDAGPPAAPLELHRPARPRLTRTLLTLAASVAVVIAVSVGAVNLIQAANRSPGVVALQQIESASDAQASAVHSADGATATAHWSGSLGKAVLVTEDLPPAASGQTYELWFVRADGTPVSAGTFSAGGGTTTTLLAGPMEAGDTIAVTIEHEGGSPTGLPTTEPILAITTT